MTREEAKRKAQSRDCSCVLGKDRDTNFNEVLDEVFDYVDSLKIVIETLKELKQEQQNSYEDEILRRLEKRTCF